MIVPPVWLAVPLVGLAISLDVIAYFVPDGAPLLSLAVIGDWGARAGSSDQKEQIRLAKRLERIHGEMELAGVLALGDNFYPHGIQECDAAEMVTHGAKACSADEHNWRFNSTFENIYEIDVPFHAALGNHDYYHSGNVTAQVAYTAKSARWHMPSRWYSWSEQSSGLTAHFIVLDTVVLAGETIENQVGRMHPPSDMGAAERQWKWLEKDLANASRSGADYIFVAGHYPVHSVCAHGPTDSAGFAPRLSALLERFNVTAYLAGHEHCMEVLQDHGVTYVVSGAGTECCYWVPNRARVPKNSLQFLYASSIAGEEQQRPAALALIHMDSRSAWIEIVDRDGVQHFTSARIAARGRSATALPVDTPETLSRAELDLCATLDRARLLLALVAAAIALVS